LWWVCDGLGFAADYQPGMTDVLAEDRGKCYLRPAVLLNQRSLLKERLLWTFFIERCFFNNHRLSPFESSFGQINIASLSRLVSITKKERSLGKARLPGSGVECTGMWKNSL
jgi:hypothetical protein